MKKVLLTIAVLFSLGAKAQMPTVRIDSPNMRIYAQIQPITLPYFTDSVSAVRLYIEFRQPIVPAWIATIWYGLYYARVIDSSTTVYEQLISDVVQIHTPGTLTGLQASAAAMIYVRDSVSYKGNKLNFEFE